MSNGTTIIMRTGHRDSASSKMSSETTQVVRVQDESDTASERFTTGAKQRTQTQLNDKEGNRRSQNITDGGNDNDSNFFDDVEIKRGFDASSMGGDSQYGVMVKGKAKALQNGLHGDDESNYNYYKEGRDFDDDNDSQGSMPYQRNSLLDRREGSEVVRNV